MNGLVGGIRHLVRLLPRLARMLAGLLADRAVPRSAKIALAAVAVYLASPLDLIPDFIPVIGYLDDLIVVPLGIALALKLIPAPVMADCRTRALAADKLPLSRAGAATIIALWLAAAVFAFLVLRNLFAS